MTLCHGMNVEAVSSTLAVHENTRSAGNSSVTAKVKRIFSKRSTVKERTMTAVRIQRATRVQDELFPFDRSSQYYD